MLDLKRIFAIIAPVEGNKAYQQNI
jgi:hypothetical protein